MRLPDLWLLHPAVVHFPIALLSLGLAAQWWSVLRREPSWPAEAAPWLLWLGTASAWLSMALGLLAEDTAPHVPAAWETLAEHKELAFWTVGLFSVLSVWCWASRPRRFLPAWPVPPQFFANPRWEQAFSAAWCLACAVLLSTAYHGGEAVFAFGMGVKR